MAVRQRQVNSSNIGEITLMSPGDILLLYSDGVYDGSDEDDRLRLETIVRNLKNRAAKEICAAILDYALEQDRYIQQAGEQDRIDDKTAFVIKHF
jgi:serine phosphatase RsbU (regulator of sigma subunit)